ncbi:MAG: hypothetical protein ACI9WU_003190 [Myxococcota bacterium]|jgi:hypothetical protein
MRILDAGLVARGGAMRGTVFGGSVFGGWVRGSWVIAGTVAAMSLGCGSDSTVFIDGTGADGTTTSTTGGAGADGGGGVGDGGGSDADQTTTGIDIPTGENVVCPTAKEQPTGKGYPFTGFEVSPDTPKSSGTTYSFPCTMCPGGTLGISGKYKYFEGDDVSSPSTEEWSETWEFDGNRFVNRLAGVDSADGVRKEVVTEGYYFCPDPDALTDIKSPDFWNVVLVYLKATPNGAFGIDAPVADLAFVGIETIGAADRIGVAVNLWWDPAATWQTTDQYCRIGTELNGRPCDDPFK